MTRWVHTMTHNGRHHGGTMNDHGPDDGHTIIIIMSQMMYY
jgi:hypothetical protein